MPYKTIQHMPRKKSVKMRTIGKAVHTPRKRPVTAHAKRRAADAPREKPLPAQAKGRPDASNFYKDVIRKNPAFKSKRRISDPSLLEPITRQLVDAIILDAKARGLKLVIWETYRSTERQRFLFRTGKTRLKDVGVHHYGLACDLVKDIDGKPSWDGDFALLGELAHQHRLIWGGDWGDPTVQHDLIDEYHVQRCAISMQTALFNGQWYPDDRYDPYKRTTIARKTPVGC